MERTITEFSSAPPPDLFRSHGIFDLTMGINGDFLVGYAALTHPTGLVKGASIRLIFHPVEAPITIQVRELVIEKVPDFR